MTPVATLHDLKEFIAVIMPVALIACATTAIVGGVALSLAAGILYELHKRRPKQWTLNIVKRG